jgi:hypothetical protein
VSFQCRAMRKQDFPSGCLVKRSVNTAMAGKGEVERPDHSHAMRDVLPGWGRTEARQGFRTLSCRCPNSSGTARRPGCDGKSCADVASLTGASARERATASRRRLLRLPCGARRGGHGLTAGHSAPNRCRSGLYGLGNTGDERASLTARSVRSNRVMPHLRAWSMRWRIAPLPGEVVARRGDALRLGCRATCRRNGLRAMGLPNVHIGRTAALTVAFGGVSARRWTLRGRIRWTSVALRSFGRAASGSTGSPRAPSSLRAREDRLRESASFG